MIFSSSSSLRLFEFLISLYPEDLRRDYGAEMAFVFGEDLETAWRETGLCGVMGVWRRALVEFVQLALPECASRPSVRVPALTLLGFLAMLSGFTGSSPSGVDFDYFHMVLLLPLFSPPLIFLFAILASQGVGIRQFGLSNRTDDEKRLCSKRAG
jgi:hypothetical protein